MFWDAMERATKFQNVPGLLRFDFDLSPKCNLKMYFKGVSHCNPEHSGMYQNVLFHCFSLELSKSFDLKSFVMTHISKKFKLSLKDI